MQPCNLLVIMSDELMRPALGCYGNALDPTPAIDRLALRGTLFERAYTPSTVCVPARACLATGRWQHEVGFWDNGDPYDGSVASWHHRLRDAGRRVDAIGKLHFRSGDDDNGFGQELLAMHVVEGKGDLLGLVRDRLPKRRNAWKMARLAGPGESSYTRYDRDILARAQIWLREAADRREAEPWTLLVSFVAPHFPLTAPPEHYYRFLGDPRLPMPKLYDRASRPDHPYHREYGECFAYDEHFEDAAAVRRAVAGYYGLVAFLDENVGKLLACLGDCGLEASTRVIFFSDHGDNLGARGLWGKSTMYEESVGVPLILAGPDVPRARVCRTAASLVDVHPTALEAAGLPPEPHDSALPRRSLLDLARTPDDLLRPAFSEYHGMGSTGASFMLCDRRWKYVHYLNHPPQLFDLQNDPEELVDLGRDPAYAGLRRCLEQRLREICAPEAVDAAAKARQGELLAANGGREAVVARGDLGFSPPPGGAADFAA